MTTLPNFVIERIEELPFGLKPTSALSVERKYHPELYDWLMVGEVSKKNQEAFLRAYWNKKEALYYAKLKTNNLIPPIYLNKDLATNEFFLADKDNSNSIQTLFTKDELESLLGQDITSYELVPCEVSHDDDKYRFDEDGYDVNGFNKRGYNREGYDIDGYDKDGYDHEGFNHEGYGRNGYDRDGYNRDGYDHLGLDKDGYDRDGYNRDGYYIGDFDKNGYDKDGYDEFGYDKDGYDEFGYDKDGYNRMLYDIKLYDIDGDQIIL